LFSFLCFFFFFFLLFCFFEYISLRFVFSSLLCFAASFRSLQGHQSLFLWVFFFQRFYEKGIAYIEGFFNKKNLIKVFSFKKSWAFLLKPSFPLILYISLYNSQPFVNPHSNKIQKNQRVASSPFPEFSPFPLQFFLAKLGLHLFFRTSQR